jgi:hypothetical protein
MLFMCHARDRALETELIEKDVVHEARLKQLFGEKVSIVFTRINAVHIVLDCTRYVADLNS